ncbi:MAG: VWA domain-containing protein, partial [Spirochaetes bacterium]|nr:VWA domain-containing protein [Spirochaetota bacterium]
MFRRIILFLNMLLIFTQFTFGESLRISQIDPSKLLLDQNIKVYISITDDTGKPIKNLTKDLFTIFESPDKKKFKKTMIVDFQENANYESGINFLLLIDNSGSMYMDMNGKRTKDINKKRITNAKNAVHDFLNSITNIEDKIGIASYNSYYKSFSTPINDKEKIYDYLENIKEPLEDNEGWTEIYSSIYLAVDDFRAVKGRKAIIILSDGENMPYYKYAKKLHKTFGNKIFNYKEPIDNCLKEGISVFAINFGNPNQKKDKNLKKIAIQTGGTVFNAYSQNELSSIYLNIKEQILNEYLITYRATMDAADKKFVRVNYENKNEKQSVMRFYFSSTIFGLPLKEFNPLLLLLLLLACILLWLLSLIKFKKRKTSPSLEVLGTQVGTIIKKSIAINKGQTIIGGAKNADMTIMHAPKIKDEHATIVFDDKKDIYTIVSKGDLTVNNKTVTTKILE